MKTFTVFLLSCLYACSEVVSTSSDAQDPLTLQLTNGKIKGRDLLTNRGNRARVYLGIPYAEPPLGRLRYAKTEPLEKTWSDSLDCTKYRAACLSNSSFTTTKQNFIDEDCLFINVMSGMNCTPTNTCPVILHIHGGAHTFGSPNMFHPEEIVDRYSARGIVFATIGYRLASFAFWNTGDEHTAGNYMIYDMIEGLRWVQKEIGKFGGAAGSVTLQGYSSSAMDISLLTLTPRLPSGLFHRAIMMSGNAVGPNLMLSTTQQSKELALELGCATPQQWDSGNNFAEILECMRGIESNELLAAQRRLEDRGVQFSTPSLDGEKGLFPQTENEMARKRNPYPIITGTTYYEFSSPFLAELLYPNASFLNLSQACSVASLTINVSHPLALGPICAAWYQQNINMSNSALMGQVLSDVEGFLPCWSDASSMVAAGGTTYLYSFDYVKKGQEGFSPMHASDLIYALGLHLFTLDERDKVVVQEYPEFFVNFAKFGNPTPWSSPDKAWKPLETPSSFNFYKYDVPLSENKDDYHQDVIRFWTQIAPAIHSFLPDRNLHNTSTERIQFSQSFMGSLQKISPSTSNLVLNKQQLLNLQAVTPGYSVQNGVDWQTAFWVTGCVAVLLVVGLGFTIGLRYCSGKQAMHQMDDFTTANDETEDLIFDEKTRLLVPSGVARNKHSAI